MIRPQNDLDKAKKWSEKTGCYLPGKNYMDLYRKDDSSAQIQEGIELSRQQLHNRIWGL